jgi:hypothetical protein
VLNQRMMLAAADSISHSPDIIGRDGGHTGEIIQR